MPIKRFKRVLSSLSVRLFIWLFAVIVLVFVSYAVIITRTNSRRWTETLEQDARRTSETIKQATHYGMLLNQKEDVHHTIRRIAGGPGVAGIRIYDKRGVITFSSDAAEIGKRVDLKADGCVICHDEAKPLRRVPARNRTRVYQGPDGERVLGLINPIENEPACSKASCHAHPPDRTVLGVLDVRLSMAAADRSRQETLRQTVIATLLMALATGVISALFIFRMVRAPVRRLIQATRRVASGDLESSVETGRRDELGELAASFETMTVELDRARRELREWSRRLERKVVEKAEELGEAQRQILHMEKMASLGKLAATVAHELNNPLAGILNYAKLVGRDLDAGELSPEERAELARFVTMIQKESSRCGEIVRNLLLFTRRGGASFSRHRLGPIVERALMLIRHHLEMAQIELETRLPAGDDELYCDPDQLQQALVAVLVNGVEAMAAGGKLRLEVAVGAEEVTIAVSDTGPGIAPEAMPHLFEPFFSTKQNAKGVGLGLSVAYGIVQRHGGQIEIDSEPGQGATFRITLGRDQREPVREPGGLPPAELARVEELEGAVRLERTGSDET